MGRCLSLSFFKIGMTVAVFHASGKVCRVMLMLKREVTDLEITDAVSRSSLLGMHPPDALRVGNLRICFKYVFFTYRC